MALCDPVLEWEFGLSDFLRLAHVQKYSGTL